MPSADADMVATPKPSIEELQPHEDADMQALTILRSAGPLLAKRWLADGTIANYDQAKHFYVKSKRVSDIAALYTTLKTAQRKPQCGIVRGQPRAGLDGAVDRNLDNFRDEPSRVFMVDVDNYTPMLYDPVDDPAKAIDEFVDTLPQCFHNASYVWHLSGSMGHPSKEGTLRAHLWFWLAEPLTCAQAEAWALAWLGNADSTVHRTVQVNYTADPVIEDGAPPDPFAGRRLGLVERSGALVIPADMPVPDVQHDRKSRAERRGSLTDPRLKSGIVGAVCRAFEPTALPDLFPDHFEHGRRDDRRITWLHGGGSKEGVCVTDSGTHLFNSHASAPLRTAANLFDFIRAHVYGQLDADVDPDALALDPQATPSHRAMIEWAHKLPEVQREIMSGADPDAILAHNSPAVTKAPELAEAVEVSLTSDNSETSPTVVAEVVPARNDRVQRYLQHIADAPDLGRLRGPVTQAICMDRKLADLDRFTVIAPAYQARMQTLLGGVKVSLSDVKKVLRLARDATPIAAEAPEWAKEWVWCVDGDMFINTRTKVHATRTSFDAMFNRDMAAFAAKPGDVLSAWRHALERWKVPYVHATMYYPCAGTIFEMDGKRYLNQYRDTGCAPTTQRMTAPQLDAVAAIVEHLSLLVPHPEERAHLMDWLAFAIQNPGRKIRHAVVIKGTEGDGKSTLGTMLGVLLGSENVQNIAAKTLESSDFSSWASGRCINVIEELKLHGTNRHDVLNKLKPYITNDTVEEHVKGKSPRDVPNVVNYIVFTNFDDAMPLEESDRRYFYLRTPFATAHGLQRALDRHGGREHYFRRLIDDGIKAHGEALKRYWLDYPVRSTFSPDMPAPKTSAKARAVAVSRSDEEELLREILDEDGRWRYGTAGVVSGTEVQRELIRRLHDDAAGFPRKISGSWFNSLAAKCGWVSVAPSNRIRLPGGDKHRVYVREDCELLSADSTADEVRAVLERLEKERQEKERQEKVRLDDEAFA